MMRYWNQNWLCGPGSFFHGPLGMLINLAFWLLIIVLAVWLFQTIIRKKNTTEGSLGPQEVLKHRYAAGKINREEFERMKKELQG
jgi:putative membrane protein